MAASVPHVGPPVRPLVQRALWLAVWAMFMIYGAVRAPVPAVNEPHYFGKAEHFWNLNFAPGDLFLESSNPHLVFYVVFGWLMLWLPPPIVAWIGRVVGYGLLAAGWTALCRVVTGRAATALPAAALFLLFAAVGNFSGEWLVGGIESKTFAYGLLFYGLAWQCERRLLAAAAALGVATAFHPVVGVWGVLCASVAEVAGRLILHRRKSSIRQDFAAGLLALLCSLPGLVPAVAALGGSNPTAAARANYLQVFVRLKHHLDPSQFAPAAYALYLMLLGGWLGMLWLRRKRIAVDTGPELLLSLFVVTSVLVAAVGVAIGWHAGSAWTMPHRDLRAWLLKFYPFRLADVFLPLAFAIAAARWLEDWQFCGSGRRIVINLLTVGMLATALLLPSVDRSPDRLTPAAHADWVAVSGFIREQTPTDALVISPPMTWGFRWHARRAEYVDHKDMPQDTAALLEWERRFGVLHNWTAALTKRPISAADLQELRRLTGADYLVAPRNYGPVEAPPVYANSRYRLFALPR